MDAQSSPYEIMIVHLRWYLILRTDLNNCSFYDRYQKEKLHPGLFKFDMSKATRQFSLVKAPTPTQQQLEFYVLPYQLLFIPSTLSPSNLTLNVNQNVSAVGSLVH